MEYIDLDNMSYDDLGFQKRGRKKGCNILKIVLVILTILIIFSLIMFLWYKTGIGPVDKKNPKEISFTIKKGSTLKNMGKSLKQAGLIKNEFAFKMYLYFNKPKNIIAGEYLISTNKNVKEILDIIGKGEININNSKFVIIEGTTLKTVIKDIAKYTGKSQEEVKNVLTDKEFMNELIDKYWFLTDDILKEGVKNPLEGYLYPETYILDKSNSDVKDIIKVALNETAKRLEKYKEKIEKSDLKVNEIFALASVVEKESSNIKYKKGIAGVFLNRIKKDMKLQSDPTVFYAIDAPYGSKELTRSDLKTESSYNTYGKGMEGKVPIGPISMLTISSIEAVLEPEETDALFFVSDKDGKIYFTRTNEEHENIIKELKEKGLWQ